MSCSIELSNKIPFCTFFFFIFTSSKCSSWPLWPSFHDQVVGVYWYGSSWLVDDFLWEGFGPETSKVLEQIFLFLFFWIYFVCASHKNPQTFMMQLPSSNANKKGVLYEKSILSISQPTKRPRWLRIAKDAIFDARKLAICCFSLRWLIVIGFNRIQSNVSVWFLVWRIWSCRDALGFLKFLLEPFFHVCCWSAWMRL